MKKRRITGISVVLNCILVAALLLLLFHYGTLTSVFDSIKGASDSSSGTFKETPSYKINNSVFGDSIASKGGIVFLGDSITNTNEWNEAFPEINIINRGIDGDTTAGVLNRLDNIVMLEPEDIFILIGINDIFQNIDESTVLKNYTDIVSKLKNSLPNTNIYIESIFPIEESLSNDNYSTSISNEYIKGINAGLKKISESQQVKYIDCFDKFITNGNLDLKYTVDGVHLNGSGYRLFEDILSKYLTNS